MVRVIYLTRYCDYSTAESGGLPWAAMAMISLLTHRRPDTEYLNSLGLPPLCVDSKKIPEMVVITSYFIC